MPSEFGFEPHSPRYGPFLVLGLFDTNNAHFGPFLAIFGLSVRHIVELEGNKGLFVTGQSGHTCGVAAISLRLSVLTRFQGRLGPKKDCLGHKMCSFGRAPPPSPPPPRGITGEILAQNLDLARPRPRL